MKTLKELQEAKKTVAFTFGRFNPPTTGHEKLIKALSGQDRNIMVFPSHSQDAKKNPLPHARKIAYMKKMFPRFAKNIMTSKARNVFEIATLLYDQGYTDIVMVVGSDRVKEFDSLLKKYDGEEGRHGFYEFSSITVVSAGDRDPDAEGVEGMSASKMRAAAVANDFDSFKQGLPRGFRDGKKLFDDIRKEMNVNEQNWTDEEIMRDAYIRGEVWNVGDVVRTKLGEEGTIIRKGTNYVVFEDMQRVWLHDLEEEPKKITKTKQAKGEVGDMKGTQPAKYYSKGAQGKEMSLATKKARARHFAKGDSRKPAPGDSAKTKPSQYTKKFKQMYGEQDKEKKPQSDVMVDREKLKDLEVKKRMATLQAKIAKDQETLAKMQIADKQAKDRKKNESVDERKLTGAEKNKLKDLEKEVPKKDFIDRYGKEEGEAIYYATLTKMAKKESLWANIHKKRQRIKQGSGERMRKKGEKGAPTADQIKRAQEELEEINVPAILKSVISRMTHPKGYAKMLQTYIQKVKDDVKKKHSNRFHAAQVATMFGLNSVFPLIDYINKLVKKGQLPMALMAQYDQNESYEIGKDYADHTKEIDPYSAPQNEKSVMKKDKKLPNLMIPKKGKSGVTKFMRRKNISKLEAENEDYQLDEKIEGLVNKSKQTGVPYSILKKSYDRGMAAWKGGHRPGATQQQWAFARVNSMLTGGKADPDLQKQIKDGGYKKKKKKSESVTRESIEEWYSDEETISLYQGRYGDEWMKKLNNTYEAMLSKLPCCDDCDEGSLIENNIYRVGSEKYFEYFQEKRKLYEDGKLKVTGFDKTLLEGDIGKYAKYFHKNVPLDCPMVEEKDVELNKPKVGGPKKYYVYVKNPDTGNIKKVTFGDTTGLRVKLNDKEAAKNFSARHNCPEQKDKTTAAYWSCNLPRYAKQLGLSGGGNFFW